MEQILIVEDDKGLNQGLCQALKQDDRQIVSCFSLQSAKEQIACILPNLVLLDLNLPDGNGLTLLKEIKANTPLLPVILLTVNDTDEDVVNGLEQGADDYITKPFSLAILRARVNMQLRKRKSEKNGYIFNKDGYLFDFSALRFSAHGVQVELSKTEQKLLRLLVENCGQTMKRTVLIDRIWTDDADYVDENALSVTVKRLRDKLDAKNHIKTVYGIGYAWVVHHE